jgi:ribosomal protein L12E/L44/L45/RPP1/RPP2
LGATNLAQVLAETNPPSISKAEAQSKSGSVKPLDAIMAGHTENAPSAPPAAAPAEKPPEPEEPAAAKAEEPGAEETPEDAVKSINDALRGLFR